MRFVIFLTGLLAIFLALTSCGCGGETKVSSATLVSEPVGGCTLEGEIEGGPTSVNVGYGELPCTFATVDFDFFDVQGNRWPELPDSTGLFVSTGERTRFHKMICVRERDGAIFLFNRPDRSCAQSLSSSGEPARDVSCGEISRLEFHVETCEDRIS